MIAQEKMWAFVLLILITTLLIYSIYIYGIYNLFRKRYSTVSVFTISSAILAIVFAGTEIVQIKPIYTYIITLILYTSPYIIFIINNLKSENYMYIMKFFAAYLAGLPVLFACYMGTGFVLVCGFGFYFGGECL